MKSLATRLRERARQLGLSDAEVGRRAGLSERRYGNYVRGAREPDLATLVRICVVLDVTPNDLLLAERLAPQGDGGRSRLLAAWNALEKEDTRLAIELVEAVQRSRQDRPEA